MSDSDNERPRVAGWKVALFLATLIIALGALIYWFDFVGKK